MQKEPSYSNFMRRRGEYSNEMFYAVNLPIDYQYKRLPRKNQLICEYLVPDLSMAWHLPLAWTHHLVFPYKDRAFWSVWITIADTDPSPADFIHRRVRAYPAGWVEAKMNDSSKDIARFLLVNSLSVHSMGERVGTQVDFPIAIDQIIEKPGVLDTAEIFSSMLSIFSGVDGYTFDTYDEKEAIIRSTFPEYRETVTKQIYGSPVGVKY